MTCAAMATDNEDVKEKTTKMRTKRTTQRKRQNRKTNMTPKKTTAITTMAKIATMATRTMTTIFDVKCFMVAANRNRT